MKVSIAMRSRNDVDFIDKTIKAILSQNFGNFEILSFDNNSVDGTKDVLKKYPQIIKFDIPEDEYVPGKVLNFAVSKCSGNIIVFNNADAVPQNNDWLKELIRPLENGEAVASFARQICRKDASVCVARDYAQAFGESSALSPDFFSLASSAASAEILRKYPFDPFIKYSEDVFWAEKIRDLGMKIAYCPKSIAEHSHNYNFKQTEKRFSGEGTADARIYGSSQSFIAFAKGFIGAVARDFSYCIRNKKFVNVFKIIRARYIQKSSYRRARNNAIAELKNEDSKRS